MSSSREIYFRTIHIHGRAQKYPHRNVQNFVATAPRTCAGLCPVSSQHRRCGITLSCFFLLRPQKDCDLQALEKRSAAETNDLWFFSIIDRSISSALGSRSSGGFAEREIRVARRAFS